MPAAMQMLAEVVADGSTEKLNKMMEAGELDPTQVMPLFAQLAEETADANGAYERSLDSARTAQRRLRFEYEQFVKVFYTQGGEDGFSKVFNSFAKFLRENGDIAKGLGETWDRFGSIVERVMVGIDNLADGFSMLSQKFGIAEGDMLGLSVVALTLMTRFGRIAAAVGILFLVLEDISVGMKGGESYTKDLLEFLDENSWIKATAAVTGFALALGGIAAAIVSIGGAMGGIPGAKGSGGKGLISAVVGSTVELVKRNPKTAAVVGGMIAYDQVASAYHSSDDPRVAEEREQIKMRIANLQRGPNAGYLTEMTNKYPLPGVNSPLSNNTTIEKVEIKVDGSKDPELVGQIVLKKIQELASDAVKNLPLTE
jgi:hypothetical protein